MPTFEVEANGKQFEIDAPDFDTAAAALKTHFGTKEPAKPAYDGSIAGDVAKSFGVGAVKGGLGLAGLPADAVNLATKGIDYLAGSETNKNYGQPAANYAGSEALTKMLTDKVGPLYEPKTDWGHGAQTVGEFAPAALGGPAGVGRRVAAQVLAPAAASEGAGYLTKGTEAEPIARAAGALVGAAGATKLLQKEAKAGATTAAELDNATTAGYNHPEVKALQIDSSKAEDVVNRITNNLKKDRFSEKQAPKTYDALESLKTAEFNGGTTHTMADFDATRRVLNKIAVDPSTEGEAARRAIRSIDAYTARIPTADVVAGDANAAAKALFEARGNAAANFRAGRIETAIEKATNNTAAANSGANMGNTLRQQVKGILNNPKQLRGFNEVERDAMRQFVRGSTSQNVMRRIGNIFGGGGGLGQLVAGGAGAAFGHAEGGAEGAGIGAVALPALGILTRNRYNASIAKQAEKLTQLMRSRSPVHQSKVAALPPSPKQISATQAALISAALSNGVSPQALMALGNYQR